MDERLRFVARLLDGEKMAAVCREFDISRKTGYKIFQRYKDCGLDGLTDRSRRPYRHANRLPFQIERLIVQLKRERPSWGAPKIRETLRRLHNEVQTPAISTVHAVLYRHGLVNRGRKRRHHAQGTTLSRPVAPNELWCADYKGEFMLADQRYCYPLTISDFASRYLISCEALSTTQEIYAFTVFERVFKEFGLPLAIRTDNGVPFASAHALFGLSKLSVWWLRLGIRIERIKPGHPEQNGRHERMHLTLKKEATKPAALNFLQQQAVHAISDEQLARRNRLNPSQPVTLGPNHSRGKRITQVSTKAWYAALKEAGIEDFRWHDLRHTWASWHVQAGTPLFALQEMGGWSSAEMVRRYAHLAADHLSPYAEKLCRPLTAVTQSLDTIWSQSPK